VVEPNIIIDCDSGICLGNSHRKSDNQIHAHRCVVRNNFVTRCPEQEILADYTRDCRIVHNTIHNPKSRLKRLIRIVHENDGLEVANNLLSGPPMRLETKSKIRIRGNVTREMGASMVDAEQGNLRLSKHVPDVVDQGKPLPGVTTDIDRRRRDASPDIGAHEWNRP